MSLPNLQQPFIRYETSPTKSRVHCGIGIMSGSSLDGLDLACVQFAQNDLGSWNFKIIAASTYLYTEEWRTELTKAMTSDGINLIKLHVNYAHFIGKTVCDFKQTYNLTPHFVACHGHTVFHMPDQGVTFQIGDGETIASYLDVPLITNFRSKDVALGGQGAPLVPFGEQHLFADFDICLNLGGIANISFAKIGFDVCPCNIILNHLAKKYDPTSLFDRNGEFAKSGAIIHEMLTHLNDAPFTLKTPPKSLGREWVDENVMPVLEEKDFETVDVLRTCVEYIAHQVMCSISRWYEGQAGSTYSMLITGGGAHNAFLMSTIQQKLEQLPYKVRLVNVDEVTVDFKEAVVFAFLGLCCLKGESNVCGQQTGSVIDSVAGSIHQPGRTAKTKYSLSPFK